MREILFRGMDIKGKWHIGNIAEVAESPHPGVDAGMYISNTFGMPFAYQIRPETRGQYIGLLDKNDKRIFEDDILSCGLIKGYVEFSGVGYSLTYGDHGYVLKPKDYLESEIIGNIHENKYMIEE